MINIQPMSVNFEFELEDIDAVELLGIFTAWLEIYGESLNTKPEWITDELTDAWQYVVINELYEFTIRTLYIRNWLTYPETYYQMFQHIASARLTIPEVELIPHTEEELNQVLHLDVLLRHLLPSVSDKAVIVRAAILNASGDDIGDRDPVEYMLDLALDFSKMVVALES